MLLISIAFRWSIVHRLGTPGGILTSWLRSNFALFVVLRNICQSETRAALEGFVVPREEIVSNITSSFLWSKLPTPAVSRCFKVKKNGVFLFGISFFVVETFTFLYYVNEESDDVINSSTKTIKYWIKNISRNIAAVFLKLGTRNVHHKRNKMTAVMPLPRQQLCRWPCFNYN